MSTFLDKCLKQLEKVGIAPEIIAHLHTHIQQAASPGLFQISPYRLADTWNLPRHDVLEAFLYGTRLGIFDLKWHIRCPSCKGVIAPSDHLNLLRPDAHCEYCRIDFRANFDDAIEVTFDVNENIRPGEPGNWLIFHENRYAINPLKWLELIAYWKWIETQATVHVKAIGVKKLHITLEAGTYYLHDRQFFQLFVPFIVTDEAAQSTQDVQVLYDGISLTRADYRSYRPGNFVIRVKNSSTQPVDLIVSRRIPYPWTSAAQIASAQTFRDLFASELIALDETFAIRNMVFVFTDIKGSTALYERLGDADAYMLVKEHFKILTRHIKKCHGAVVKTIGDAVMAAFLVSKDAMQALFDVQQAFEHFHIGEELRKDIHIKIGAHRGPCIAVTLNDRLDYFGQTVNIAARVQGLSTGGDIMLTQSFYGDPDVREIVKNSDWDIQHFRTRLRGTEDMYDIIHLFPPTPLP